jgi:hypothetical protein
LGPVGEGFFSIRTPLATDIITYIGVPLAILVVSPILYNFLVAIYVKFRILQILQANRIEGTIRRRFMIGIVKVELPIYALYLRLGSCLICDFLWDLGWMQLRWIGYIGVLGLETLE